VTPLYAAPLSAVDHMQVRRADPGLVVTATKDIVTGDPYLAAHFPGRTVYPGVFVLETVRQAAIAALGEGPGGLAELSAVCSLRFAGAMHPGERLCAEVTITPAAGGGFRAAARCRRADGSDVARMTLEFRYPGGEGA
jgi:3-hydroxymyristoyl/3-hydroxydecanoyl-(acyl carrier protein) dehydratase